MTVFAIWGAGAVIAVAVLSAEALVYKRVEDSGGSRKNKLVHHVMQRYSNHRKRRLRPEEEVELSLRLNKAIQELRTNQDEEDEERLRARLLAALIEARDLLKMAY